ARVPERHGGRESGEKDGRGDHEHQHAEPHRHSAPRPLHQAVLPCGRACALRTGSRTRKMIPPSRLTETAIRKVVNWSEKASARLTPINPNSTTPAPSRTPMPFNEMGRETITASNGTKRKK